MSNSRPTKWRGQLQLVGYLLAAISVCNSCAAPAAEADRIGRAFQQHQSNVAVEGEGVVSKLLSDDTDGLSHQRFILRLPSGQTVLIEHNTDVAPRVEGLKPGDTVSFSGEYVWNAQGGLIHWTHHDPANRHQAGWLKHNGRTYQ